MSSARGFRDSLQAYVPAWMSNRPGLNTTFKMLYALALPLDVLLEGLTEGMQAKFPGYAGPDALAYIGRSRGITRGEAETNPSYTARLLAWIDTWGNAGSDALLAQLIQGYLANNPVVRIVARSGQTVTANQDGTTSIATMAWNWDGISNPERSTFWSDIWIIVYPCEWPITGTALTSLASIWGTATPPGNGHAVSGASVDGVLGLVAAWKGAHTYVRAIVWSYDSTLFVPGSPVAGDPDGTWGNWAKTVSGNQVAARNPSCRYWEPPNG